MKRSILFSVIFLFVISCADDSNVTFTPGGIAIGAVYPLSGMQAAAGQEIRQGIELGLEIINNEFPDLDLPLAQNRGLPSLGGVPLEVLFADHQSMPVVVSDETERLIRVNHVVALIGAYESESTRIASEVAEEAGVPFLNAESTSPSLTERGFQWFFRTTPTDTTFVTNSFQFISDLNVERGAGLRRVALIRESTDFGTGFADLATAIAPQYGMEVVSDVISDGVDTSVPAAVTEVQAAQPDVVLFAVYTDDAILFMQEFKRQGFAPPLIWADDAGFISQEFQETLGEDAAYVTSREVWSLDVTQTNQLADQINALYRERYGVDLNGNSARAFIGLMTLAQAIERAASTQPEAVLSALQETDIPADQLITPWNGIRFDDTGQNTLGQGIVVQMLNGRYTTVWPYDIAVEPVVFPFPAWDGR